VPEIKSEVPTDDELRHYMAEWEQQLGQLADRPQSECAWLTVAPQTQT